MIKRKHVSKLVAFRWFEDLASRTTSDKVKPKKSI